MTTKITTDNIASTTLDVISGVKVSAIVYPGNDTAADTAGNQTITLNGAGFKATPTVIVNGVSASVVTFVSSTQITFTAPANNAGTYVIYVVNPDGSTAIVVPGISYSGTPTWSTAAGSLGNVYETTAINNTVTATGDAPITYSLQTGTLPPGSSLNSANGLLSGTSSATENTTVYTFTIRASDAQNQETDRQFSLTINPDVVTWSSPANNSTVSANIGVSTNITMSATSVAGYNVTYTADTLPTGLTISGENITGTPTTVANTTSTLTATAATSNRTATRTINWSVTLGNDPYFNYTALLINAETVTANAWIDDASTNKFAITVNGDTKPTAFSPYETVWSNYFDGTGDYLLVPSDSAFDLPGDFTIELWINLANVGSSWQAILSRAYNVTGGWRLYKTQTDAELHWYAGGTSTVLTSNSGIANNVWSHVAVVRQGTTLTIYVNGVSRGSATNSTNYTPGNYSVEIGAGVVTSSFPITGYISNLRIVKGTAVYTSNFTPPTSPLTAIANTSLLTCQSNRLIDNSTNNFTITKNGDVTVSNFGPFVETDTTTGSGYFDGTGDYLSIAANAAFNFGTGDFTIELYFYRSGIKGNSFHDNIIGNRPTSFSSGQWHLYVGPAAGGAFALQVRTSGGDIALSGGVCVENAWNHLAVVRNGTSLSLFVNGISVNSTTTSASIGDSVSNLGVAAFNDGAYLTIGYISNLRIVKGTAVYTSNFTPPTSPLTAVTNTSLLTLQYRTGENNNRFVDTSGSNSIITRSGNATQGTFSPYSLTGWSNYFDGTGDYLSFANNAALNPGTDDFVMEAWVYITGLTAANQGFNGKGTAGTDGYSFYITNALVLSFIWNGTGGTTITGGTLNQNQWHHVAVVRNSNVIRLYLDGVGAASSTACTTNITSTGTKFVGQARGGNPILGYMSNYRMIKGSRPATYDATSASLVTPTSPLTAIANTSLLTCQSNRFVDNSANNFTVTRVGDTSVQSFSPFGSRSVTPISYGVYFDGTGDYLTVASSANLALTTNDFTIEFFIYVSAAAIPANVTIFDQRTGTNGAGVIRPVIELTSGNGYAWYVAAANKITSGTAPVILNAWQHLVVARSGTNTKMFLDGVQVGSTFSTDTYNYPAGDTRIGQANDGVSTRNLTGYISNFRVIIGTALYTSNFTAPTAPLTAIANTSLLTCQSSAIIDNSTNNFTITVNGDAIPKEFNPFGNTITSGAEYSVTTVGGSMYFDGTTDYITVANSIGIKFGTSPFTIEFWMYRSSSATAAGALLAMNGAAYGNWSIVMTGGSMYFQDYYATNSLNNYFTTDTSGIPPFTWAHVAYVRVSGGSSRFYVNGKPVGTAVTDTRDYAGTGSLLVGGVPSAGYGSFTGYISNVRIVKGSSLYTSPFNPPVSLMQSISGTTLMLNGTNGGIIDYTGKNNLEVLGNVNTTNAVTKYGSRSLYFDGTDDAVVMPYSSLFDFGTGQFTIECWVNFNVLSGNIILFDTYTSAAAGGGYQLYWRGTGTSITFYANGVVVAQSSFTGHVTGTWYHIACTRDSSGTVRIFVDGTSYASASYTSSITMATTGKAALGLQFSTSTNDFNGYIDDLRITKGYARYTANFTPPAGALIAK